MRWFDDLWLKEGFATYMAAKAMADLEPTSDAWKTFYQSNKPVAYGVDQTTGTTPLWQELANLDQARAPTAQSSTTSAELAQTTQLSRRRESVQAGVHQFLSDHAYAKRDVAGPSRRDR